MKPVVIYYSSKKIDKIPTKYGENSVVKLAPPSIDVMLGVKIHVTILEKLDVSSKNLSMLVLEEELKVHFELLNTIDYFLIFFWGSNRVKH